MNHPPVAERILTASTSLFLLVAPFTSSAGWRAATLIVSLSCLVYLALTRRLAIPGPAPRALLLALAAWCALAIASLAWTVDREQSLEELRRQLLYGAFAFTIFYLAANRARWRVWWTTMLLGAVALVVAESLRAHLEPRFGLRAWDGGGGAFSTHLVMLAPLLLPLAWSERDDQPPRAVLFFVALLLLFAVAWSTENRIVWPALLAAFATAALALRFARPAPPRLHGMRYMALAAFALIVTLAALTSSHRSHVDASVRSGGMVSLEIDLRPALWKAATEEIAKAPWLGHGYGREIASGALRPLTPRHIDHPDLLHAHNMFLNIALQLGTVGLVLFATILALLAREFVRALRERESCAVGILGLAVLAGFVAKNLTDDFLYRHNGLFFWALMGMLLGLARDRSRP